MNRATCVIPSPPRHSRAGGNPVKKTFLMYKIKPETGCYMYYYAVSREFAEDRTGVQ